MRAMIAAALTAPLLTGCGVNTADIVQALAKDTASVCVSLTTAFPPWASTARACRTNGSGSSVTVDPAGNMIMTAPTRTP